MKRTVGMTTDDGVTIRSVLAVALMIAGLGLGGCVRIEAPDKPIEINLNINIRQEVVYRLDGDAKELIEEQADIF